VRRVFTTAVAATAGAGSLAWLASRTVGRSIGGAISRVTSTDDPQRWLKVTIGCPPERLSPDGGGLPEPVARLGGRAEIRIEPAPGDRGTELGLRPVQPPQPGAAGLVARLRGDDPRQELRSALRDAKSLIETGEVIRPDEPPTTHPTVTGKLVDQVLARAGGEGRL
jgi:hypothetical protein